MGVLSEKLKTIYASGDALTVLKLLNALIKEVEDYESIRGLYRHHVVLRLGQTFGATIQARLEVEVYTASAEQLTLSTLKDALPKNYIITASSYTGCNVGIVYSGAGPIGLLGYGALSLYQNDGPSSPYNLKVTGTKVDGTVTTVSESGISIAADIVTQII